MSHVSILLAAGLAATSATAGTLSIAFVHPENYTDAAYSRAFATGRDRALVQRDIEQHLLKLAERRLPAGDSLKIEVFDIDLAGHFEPAGMRHGAEVRIVRDITSPRIKLRYTWTRGEQVVASAEEQIGDMNFLMTPNRYAPDDRLRYERAMLDDWFEKRFRTP